MITRRQLPVPSELSREFWDAAAEHRLVLPCCDKCGHFFFPPERLCPSCRSELWTYAESAGGGTVAAFTVVHKAPSAQFATPYVLAVVELDEGCTLLTNLELDDPQSASIGVRVRVAFLDHEDGRALPVFAAAAPVPDQPVKEGP